MKLLLSLITFIYLLTPNNAQDLLGAYEPCIGPCLQEAKTDMIGIEEQMKLLLSLEAGTHIEIESVQMQMQIVAGKNYRVTFFVTEEGSTTYEKTIQFSIDLTGEYIADSLILIETDSGDSSIYAAGDSAPEYEDCMCAYPSESSEEDSQVCCDGTTYESACKAECAGHIMVSAYIKDFVESDCESGACPNPAAVEGAIEDESMVGAFDSCTGTCLKDAKLGIIAIEDEIKVLLNIEGATYVKIESVQMQVVAGKNYRVTFLVNTTDISYEETIQFSIDLEGEYIADSLMLLEPDSDDSSVYGAEGVTDNEDISIEDCMCAFPSDSSEENDQVCCGGITYRNACKAECEGHLIVSEYIQSIVESDCTSGACPNAAAANPIDYSIEVSDSTDSKLCACTADIDYVCCDGNQYANPCGAKCAGEDQHDCQSGECIATDESAQVYLGDREKGAKAVHDSDESPLMMIVPDSDEEVEIVSRYIAAISDKLLEAKLYIDSIEEEIQNALSLAEDCEIETKSAEWENVPEAIQFRVLIGVCDGTERTVVFVVGFGEDTISDSNWQILESDSDSISYAAGGSASENEDCMCAYPSESSEEDSQVCCDGTTYESVCKAECAGHIMVSDYIKDIVDNDCESGACEDTAAYGAEDTEDVSGESSDLPVTKSPKRSKGIDIDPDIDACRAECDYGTWLPYGCTNAEDICTTYSNLCDALCDDMIEANCVSGECAAPAGGSAAENEDCMCAYPSESSEEDSRVCCEGTTYDSACEAECEGHIMVSAYITDIMASDCVSGACEDVSAAEEASENADQKQIRHLSNLCQCTYVVNPICCEENNYYNPCLAECAGFEDAVNDDRCESGECIPQCICNMNDDPYCCEGTEYSNACLAECAGFENVISNTEQCAPGICCDCDTYDLDPVCCDGREYANECEADCVGYLNANTNSLCVPQACEQYGGAEDHSNEDEPCTTQYLPVCCTDKWGIRVTHDNICLAETQGHINDIEQDCTDGACANDCGCVASETDTQYCCFDIEYPNECEAVCAGVMHVERRCSEGTCEGYSQPPLEPCICTEIEDPICCRDDTGVTHQYSSPCQAECEGYEWPAIEDEHCELGSCEEDFPCACAQIYEPVCCDGVDFASQCDADCESVSDCVAGTCESDSVSSAECGCTREYAPVCCNEGEDDYNNGCLAECEDDSVDNAEEQCESSSCAAVDCGCGGDPAPYCCEGITYDNGCVAECNSVPNYETECSQGVCVDGYGSKTGYSGIFSLGTPTGNSQWNVMIVIIQLCILAVCCMSLGLSISFCFKNPNKLLHIDDMHMHGHDQGKVSFGRDH